MHHSYLTCTLGSQQHHSASFEDSEGTCKSLANKLLGAGRLHVGSLLGLRAFRWIYREFSQPFWWESYQLVEAQPAFAEKLSRNRPRAHVLHGAIGPHANCTFFDVRLPGGGTEPGWSGLAPRHVPAGATRVVAAL